MNGSGFAPGMLFASLGFALAFSASRRALAVGLAVVVLTAAGVVVLKLRLSGPLPALTGCWIAVLAAAASLYFSRPIGLRVALPLCAFGGLLAGLTIVGTGESIRLATSLPWVLSSVPSAWLVGRGHGIIVKVGGSWLAAAAVLSLGLNMVPTLGYEPDHRE